jgi:hypothetical protein
LLLAACGGEEPAKHPDAPVDLNVKPAKPPAYTTDDAQWGKFHSKRFNLTVSLPDGKTWKIDDHTTPDMLATHAATQSRFSARTTIEEGLMNRQRCEERARKLGLLPDDADKRYSTIDDQVWTTPDAWDARLWVAIETGQPGGAVVGHVYEFASFVRRCLIVHLTTSVASGKEEQTLATRLVVAEEKIVKHLEVDPARTDQDTELPKEKPEIRR